MTRQWLSRQSRSFLPALVLLTTLLVPLFLAPEAGAQLPLSGERICLDPGHGGSDPGAVNEFYNLRESEINLDVSYALGALLEAGGAAVAMTRSTNDEYLTNRDRYTFCNDWQATLLISVHTNSVDKPTWDGSTTLWSKREDEALARAIHAVLYPDLRDTAPKPEEFLDFGLTKFQSGVLLKSDMPAAMMEPVFMSYPAEAELLRTPVCYASDDRVQLDLSCRRSQIVQAIYQGILYYYDSSSEPTPTPTPEPGGKMHVAAIDVSGGMKGTNVFVYTSVTIVDEGGIPVPGADVTIATTGPDGFFVSHTATTGEDGVASFTLRSRQPGSYTSTVEEVSKGGWTYEPGANVESSESVSVP